MKITFSISGLAALVALSAVWVQPIQLPEYFRQGREISAGRLLLASEYFMKDPHFSGSVVLLIRQDQDGAVGLVLNQPTKVSIRQVFPEITEPLHMGNPVYIGGPVERRQFFLLVRTDRKEEGLLQVLEHVSFSANRDTILDWLAREKGKERIRLFTGYSGWGSGQLEAEMKIGGWNLVDADAETIFQTEPSKMWQELTARTTQQEVRLMH